MTIAVLSLKSFFSTSTLPLLIVAVLKRERFCTSRITSSFDNSSTDDVTDAHRLVVLIPPLLLLSAVDLLLMGSDRLPTAPDTAA